MVGSGQAWRTGREFPALGLTCSHPLVRALTNLSGPQTTHGLALNLLCFGCLSIFETSSSYESSLHGTCDGIEDILKALRDVLFEGQAHALPGDRKIAVLWGGTHYLPLSQTMGDTPVLPRGP